MNILDQKLEKSGLAATIQLGTNTPIKRESYCDLKEE